jgi:hypothetical protein
MNSDVSTRYVIVTKAASKFFTEHLSLTFVCLMCVYVRVLGTPLSVCHFFKFNPNIEILCVYNNQLDALFSLSLLN